jgi:copper oxidase (laccase) domain-containing protein
MLVDDLRSVSTLINNKINALIGLVGPGSAAATFVDPQTLATLQSMVNAAAQAISTSNKQAAITDLQNFNQFVLANSGVTIPNKSSSPGGNIAGALVGKASTLIFSLSL